MKKSTFYSTLSIVSLLFVLAMSCSKTNTSTTSPTPTATTKKFTWKENSDTTVHIADTAYLTSQYNTIIAQQKSGTTYKTIFEINLSASTAGTYALNSANVITYIVNNSYFIPTSGSVVITSNAGGKASGTFQGTGTTAGGVSSVTGSFTDILVK
ncbi:MAG: hypothetical protein JNL75_03440 [Chitinophagales bacterium]|nr:hypothetical protein [Chitinophagales bacterium]